TQCRIEDFAQAMACTDEETFLLTRRTDRTVGHPKTDERNVAIEWIENHYRPSAVDVPKEPEAARSEIDFGPCDAARTEHCHRAIDRVAFPHAAETECGSVGQGNRLRIVLHGHPIAAGMRPGIATDIRIRWGR